MNSIFSRMPKCINSCFKTVGTLSLEMYLLHVQFVLLHIEQHHLGYWLTFLLTVAITLPMAWMLQKALNYATNKIKGSL